MPEKRQEAERYSNVAMADYQPLISRAVAGLEKNTGENRRVLYERARAALVAQLRSVDPPLEEADITRERLALEEAIRKVEAEAAAKARGQRRRLRRASRRPRCATRACANFRDTVAEAGDLGAAAAGANRAARDPRPCRAIMPPAERGRAHALFRAATPGGRARPKRTSRAAARRRRRRTRRSRRKIIRRRCVPTAAWSNGWWCFWCWAGSPAPVIGSGHSSAP